MAHESKAANLTRFRVRRPIAVDDELTNRNPVSAHAILRFRAASRSATSPIVFARFRSAMFDTISR